MMSVNQTVLSGQESVFEERLCSLGLRLGEPVQTQRWTVKEEEEEEKEEWEEDEENDGLPGKLHMEGGPAQKTLRETEMRESEAGEGKPPKHQTRLSAVPPRN